MCVILDDWHHGGTFSAGSLLPRGWILEQVIRGSRTKQPFEQDHVLVQDMRAGEKVTRLNVPGLTVIPREGTAYMGEKGFKQRLRSVLKKPGMHAKAVLKERRNI